MHNDATNSEGNTPADNCPPPQLVRHWLDGKTQLSVEQTLHVRRCEDCLRSLDHLTEGSELRIGTGSLPATPQKLPFASEDALAVLQRELATPPNTPLSHFDTLEETPSQVDSHGNIPARADSRDASWLSEHFDPERYIVEGLVGRGGNADVYKLYDSLLDRQFAVKVISSDSQRGRQRMLREAKLLADIDHTNIVRVFDAGQVEDAAGSKAIFIVMEFMSGGTLAQLNDSALPVAESIFREIANLLACVCDGLSFAHGMGVVHRDLKPANILLGQNRQVAKIADFGLASRDSDSATLITRTGAILGTPAFMSPEQATGAGNISPASDIYSLGATLYFMLTGQTPFTGNPTAVARQIVDVDPVSPVVLNQACPRELVAICERAMEKASIQRYGTAEQFAADLRAFAAGDQIRAQPISPLGRVQRQLRRNRKLYVALQAVAVLAVGLLALAMGSAMVYRHQSHRLAESAVREKESKRQLQQTLMRSIEAADQLLVSVTEDLSLLPSSPGTDRISAALLDRARLYYMQFLQDNADNVELKFQLARAHAGLARIAFRSGNTEQGTAESQNALAMLTAFQGVESEEDQGQAAARARQFRASVLLVYGSSLGRASPADPKADAALVECVELCESLERQELWQGDRVDIQNTHLSALRNRAVMLGRIGRDEESGELAQKAAQLGVRLVSRQGVTGKSLKAAAEATQTLGIYFIQHQQFASGAEAIEQAMEILKRIPESEATALRIHNVRANLHTNLARIAMLRGEFAEATEQQALAIGLHKHLCTIEPDIPAHKMDLVDAMLNSTNILYAQENYAQVVEDSKAAIAVLEDLIRSDDKNPDYRQTKAMLQGNMAIVLLHQGEALLSIQPLTESIAELELVAEQLQHAPAADIAVAINHYSLSGAYYDLSQFDQSLKSLDESDAIAANVLLSVPDYSAATDHMIDSLFRRTDILFEVEPVDHARILETATQALELSDALMRAEPDVVDHQTRHLLLVTTRGSAHLGLGDLESALADAQVVLKAVPSKASDNPQADFSAPLMYAHLLEHNTLVNQLNNAADGSGLRGSIEDRIASARASAELLGAQPEDFDLP